MAVQPGGSEIRLGACGAHVHPFLRVQGVEKKTGNFLPEKGEGSSTFIKYCLSLVRLPFSKAIVIFFKSLNIYESKTKGKLGNFRAGGGGRRKKLEKKSQIKSETLPPLHFSHIYARDRRGPSPSQLEICIRASPVCSGEIPETSRLTREPGCSLRSTLPTYLFTPLPPEKSNGQEIRKGVRRPPFHSLGLCETARSPPIAARVTHDCKTFAKRRLSNLN